MFYNSFQGFILALLFCFLNEEVHNEIRRCWYKRHGDGFGTRTIFLSSWRKDSHVSRTSASQHNHVKDHNPDSVNFQKNGKDSKKREVIYKSRFVNRTQRQAPFVKKDYRTIGEADL